MRRQTADGKRQTAAIQKEQQSVLESLLKTAVDTKFGIKNDFKNIEGYRQFAKQVPAQTYHDIQPTVEQLKKGTKYIYWPGRVNHFAVSAGTSGKGKHIPVTEERLAADRRFMHKIALSYFKQRPNPFRVVGAHLSMPGSVERKDNNLIGEVSGITAQNAPGWLQMFQLASPSTLAHLSFQKKFDLVLKKSIGANVKVITASPSWILTLFQQVLKQTGKRHVKEIWPHLNVLICGGLKLTNYRPHLQKLIGDKKVDFIETYGASEGYIGFSDDLNKSDLKMVTDNGIFFECIPHPLPDKKASGIQKAVPLWKVETGVPYGLMVSTNAGLWRYAVGDIIEFTELDPHRFIVKGRVNEMLDDYGEALYVYEAEQALKKALDEFNLKANTFTLAAGLKSEKDIPVHRWFVQFAEPVHTQTLRKVAAFIDSTLQGTNRHYAIRRETDALGPPEMTSITQTDINRWLETQGKNKAQGKLPRILKTGVEVFG